MSNQEVRIRHTRFGRGAAVAAGAIALTLVGSLTLPATAHAAERGQCLELLTVYRLTVKAVAKGKMTNREGSTELAVLVEHLNDSRTAEAMMAARSLISDGKDIPRPIHKLIKRRLNNGLC